MKIKKLVENLLHFWLLCYLVCLGRSSGAQEGLRGQLCSMLLCSASWSYIVRVIWGLYLPCQRRWGGAVETWTWVQGLLRLATAVDLMAEASEGSTTASDCCGRAREVVQFMGWEDSSDDTLCCDTLAAYVTMVTVCIVRRVTHLLFRAAAAVRWRVWTMWN